MQSFSQIITTNKPTSSFFTGRMPFLSPNQQCRSTEWKNITSHVLAYPKLTWGLPTLSLTTNSSWLCGGFVMSLISPLMPLLMNITYSGPFCWPVIISRQWRFQGYPIRPCFHPVCQSTCPPPSRQRILQFQVGCFTWRPTNSVEAPKTACNVT